MRPTELLAALQARGVQLSARPDGALRVTPRSALTPELREALRANKDEVVALLQPESFEDVRAGLKRLEKELAVEDGEDFSWFCLIVRHDKTPLPPNWHQWLREQARARKLRGFHLLLAHGPSYDPWAPSPWDPPKGNGQDPHAEGSNP